VKYSEEGWENESLSRTTTTSRDRNLSYRKSVERSNMKPCQQDVFDARVGVLGSWLCLMWRGYETFVSLLPPAPEILDYEPISTATDMW